MRITRRQMALLRSIIIIIVLIAHGKSEKNTSKSIKTVKPRHLSRHSIGKILETFDAIKTIGKFFFNCEKRSSDNKQDVLQNSSLGATDVEKPNNLSSAVFTISKNVFGRNITEKVVKPLVNLSHGKISPDNRNCTTPDGAEGFCDDLKNCPQLEWSLVADSICFRNTFSSGVCCPKETSGLQRDEPLDPKPSETQATNKDSPNTSTQYTTETLSTSTTQSSDPTNLGIQAIDDSSPKTTTPSISTTQSLPENITSYTQGPSRLQKNSRISSDCGRPEIPTFRIVGGVEVSPGRWPWMAAIFIRGSFTCGGTLIGPRHILTAAHCTKNDVQISYMPKQYTVILGDIDLYRDDEPSSPEKYSVVDVRVHRRFSSMKTEFPMLFNDIAILILDRPVKRSKYVMPLCLPPKSSKPDTFVGERPTLVGWGSFDYDDHEESSIQRQVSLSVWSNENCKKIYYPYYFDENYICAGWINGGKDACHGDSGGPLMLKKNGRWIQIGIVSFGNKCGEPGTPGVYTRVTGYLDWIEKNMV